MSTFPPQSTGFADWDVVDGVSGEGGKASKYNVHSGNAGCVRIALPGFFNCMSHGCTENTPIDDLPSPRAGIKHSR